MHTRKGITQEPLTGFGGYLRDGMYALCRWHVPILSRIDTFFTELQNSKFHTTNRVFAAIFNEKRGNLTNSILMLIRGNICFIDWSTFLDKKNLLKFHRRRWDSNSFKSDIPTPLWYPHPGDITAACPGSGWYTKKLNGTIRTYFSFLFTQGE